MIARLRMLSFGSVLLLALLAAGEPANRAGPVLSVEGPEQTVVDSRKPGAGLPPVVGARSVEVFRACRVQPELSDGLGYTYHHHTDLAVWKGRIWLAWDSCQVDEDTWPSRELYSTSSDGVEWTKPGELFPHGVSTPLRMYFFHAPNGRMLVIAGLRVDHELTKENIKGPLVVREIRDDGSLGTICTLRSPPVAPATGLPPMFDSAGDAGFVEACRQLLANRVFLQTQDYGYLLDPSLRMKWNDDGMWNERDFGKALSFFHRKDGTLVAVGKKGWVTTSSDEGANWSEPVIPRSLITGNGKVWGQRTSDGRYALVYNPDKRLRFPLVMATSDDGVTFSGMRLVHGELPPQRYPGVNKSMGQSYVRGVSEWSSDGSRNDAAMWLAYSVNKEDIWVTRVPTPVLEKQASAVNDDFTAMPAGADVPGWNVYRPKWSDVSIAVAADGGKCLKLEDRDPIDHPNAVRMFPESTNATISMQVAAGLADAGACEIRLFPTFGGEAALELSFGADGKIRAGTNDIGTFSPNQWAALKIAVDCVHNKCIVSVGERDFPIDAAFDSGATINRIAFRAVASGGAEDVPARAVQFRVQRLRVETK